MGIWDSITDIAKSATDYVCDAAASAGEKIGEIASDGYDIVSSAASSAWDTVSSVSQSAWDSTCDFLGVKIKGILRGIDFQSTINSLNDIQKEKDINVGVLVDFITRLKEFSEDGK